MKQLSKHNKIVISLLAVSVVFIILGILFLVNAMQEDPENGFFPAYNYMPSLLFKYVIVIITMATGIMMFSNVALQIEDKKLRNGLTIGITTFSTILTVPLVYVFIAIFPYHAKGVMGPVGELMAIHRIDESFMRWFQDGPFLWAVYVFMLILSIVFITVPLVSGILACKGKTMQPSFKLVTLPIIQKQQKEAEQEKTIEEEKATE